MVVAYRRARCRVFAGVRWWLLIHRVEAAFFLETDAVDATALDVGRRGDAPDLASSAVAYLVSSPVPTRSPFSFLVETYHMLPTSCDSRVCFFSSQRPS